MAEFFLWTWAAAIYYKGTLEKRASSLIKFLLSVFIKISNLSLKLKTYYAQKF